MFNRDPTLPLASILNKEVPITQYESINKGFTERFKKEGEVKELIANKEMKQDKYLIKKNKIKNKNIKVGDLVLVKNSGKLKSFEPSWLGPYRVLGKTDMNTYYLDDGKNGKPYNSRIIKLYVTEQKPFEITVNEKDKVEEQEFIMNVFDNPKEDKISDSVTDDDFIDEKEKTKSTDSDDYFEVEKDQDDLVKEFKDIIVSLLKTCDSVKEANRFLKDELNTWIRSSKEIEMLLSVTKDAKNIPDMILQFELWLEKLDIRNFK